jgi:hypothetical protein
VPGEIALGPGEHGTYPLAIHDWVEQWGTPVQGEIVGCEVTSATYVVYPQPVEIIVD